MRKSVCWQVAKLFNRSPGRLLLVELLWFLLGTVGGCWILWDFAKICSSVQAKFITRKLSFNTCGKTSTLDSRTTWARLRLYWTPLMSVTSFPFSGSALRAVTADTTATPTSPVPWTQRTSGGCSTTAGTSSRECTCGSTNSCDGRLPSSAFCVSLHYSASLRNPSSSSSPHKETLNNPRPPLLSRTMKYYWSVSNPLPLS